MSTPVIIGIADIRNRSTQVTDAKEPAQLMYEAILAAILDTGVSDPEALQAEIDSIDVVRTWTWPYPDLPGLLAEKLKVVPKHRFYSEHGGNQPGKLLDEAARRLSAGECRVAVVTGGEALASLSACAAAKKLPPPGWTKPEQAVESVFTPTGRDLGDNLGAIHEIGAPIHVYPLYENAFRAHRNQSIQENNTESAKLYADFSAVAANHPYAWNYGKKDDEQTIGTVSKKNRMICFPYPLLMNAFNTVNLSAALLLTTTTHAQHLGIPSSKWIYPLGGAGTSDPDYFWHRPNFHTSPSISHSLSAALSLTSLTPPDIDLYDIYSCFPIVPKLAAHYLGLPLTGGDEKGKEKPLTLLGGLTSFGGAGNNYSMHAFTELVRRLRKGDGKRGLVLCNGGVLSYQHVVILGNEPRGDGGYPRENPLPGKLEVEAPGLAVGEEAVGEGVVETYTVEFGRDGAPAKGFVVGRLKKDGRRFLANPVDEAALRFMGSGAVEVVGRSGVVKQDPERKGRGLFTFDQAARI
ncbi:acetyl-CoA acetyltransferas-like protein [Sporormia fimetaria CBS 119925]|uniref:Acetyl-CoA acetyltransferas-like protein n=1 Tax=Sporormia fimetaria CBS 119925 TaxID=1340428 RepID=A0A6A6VLQ9_9PLEO|nr:acetyl-CoA acetyltransferas-like protein [Sporormia fimetaria CBS 119925]